MFKCVREWVTSKVSEEAAGAGPDSLTLKVTVTFHTSIQKMGYGQHIVLEHCNLRQCHCLQGEAK